MTVDYKSLSHSKWDCKYHVVFVPKRRKKELFGKIREFLKKTFHELARQKGCEIIGGHIVQDHVHMIVNISPKHAVARQFSGRQRNFNGENLWARAMLFRP